MRTIPAALLAKIQSLQQTPDGNADPKMTATIIKANSDLSIYTLANSGVLGPIDVTMQWEDLTADPEAVWVAEVIDKVGVIKVFNYAETLDFTTPDSTFNLTPVGTGATVRDIAIEFDGTLTAGVLQTSGAPYITWMERTTTHDKAYVIQWDGTGSQPAATELLSVER